MTIGVTIGDGLWGIGIGIGLGALFLSIAYVIGIHAKGSQCHWFPNHIVPKVEKNDDTTVD